MIRLLYVEDDVIFRNLVSDILKYTTDFELDLASDGESGVHKAINNEYDIIIMDIMLPDIDGWEATKRIKKVKPNLPIVALSALNLKELDANNIFEEHIRKPIRGFEFKKTLKEVASKYNKH